MDFGLDKKHEMARTLFKEFAENEVWRNMDFLVFRYRRNTRDRDVIH